MSVNPPAVSKQVRAELRRSSAVVLAAVGGVSLLAMARPAIAGSAHHLRPDADSSAATATAWSAQPIDAPAPTGQFLVHYAAGTDPSALGSQWAANLFDAPGASPGLAVFRVADPALVSAAVRRAEATAGVLAAEPMVSRRRYARDLPDDALFGSQWHLRNTGQGGGSAGADIDVAPAWNFAAGTGLGAGVNIAVVDDGLERTHADLSANYVAALSFDFVGNDADPSPGASDFHGTAVAGLAAGRGNNGVGVAGVAPRAGVSGIRLTGAGGTTTDLQESQALTYRNNNQGGTGTNHVYVNSWGAADDGVTLDGPGPLTKAALASGATAGRGGRGSIFVWAGGNGAYANPDSPLADNANYDGYANSRYVIAVGATTNSGVRAAYSERGANLFVNAPSGGGTLGLTTADRSSTVGYNTANSASGGDYTGTLSGTSGAAPLVAGVAALMLEANPTLGWRDVKHILARTAVMNDPTDSGWTINAAGRHHDDKYGFGRVDAAAAVALAKTWTNVGPELSATASATVATAIPNGSGNGPGTSFGTTLSRSLSITTALSVETVEVTVNVTHSYRGDLEFTLTGPTGTQSILGTVRSQDDGDNYANWTFSSVRYWDESSLGTWTLGIRDGFGGASGVWNSWSLAVYGTAATPVPEPAAMLAGVAAVGGLLARRRRRRGRGSREAVGI